MTAKKSILHYSLFCVLISGATVPVYAGIRVGNASRNQATAYQQVNAQVASVNMPAVAPAGTYSAGGPGATATGATGATDVLPELPIRVANPVLADSIARANADAVIDIAGLQSCANIYPGGEFAWDVPQFGNMVGQPDTCVAVVELRAVGQSQTGEDLVLARANLASGDAVKCNISDFPEQSYTLDAGNVLFPADAEPSMDDVIKIMNEEQKQDAALKIVAGAVIGGLGGNISGDNELGKDGLLGGGKSKTTNTIVGALGGAALMAGNAYAGKQAGDVILSTGVNAAAGAVVGNIAASGDSVLRIEDCEVDGVKTTCLWGVLATGKGDSSIGDDAYYNIKDGNAVVKENGAYVVKELASIKLEGNADKFVSDLTESELLTIASSNAYSLDKDEMTKSGTGSYLKISSAIEIKDKIPVMIKDVKDKSFGLKSSDWYKMKSTISADWVLARGNLGKAEPLPEGIDHYFAIEGQVQSLKKFFYLTLLNILNNHQLLNLVLLQ